MTQAPPATEGYDEPYGALYIHIPFCVSRCAYCDFTTEALPRDDEAIDRYAERVVTDIRARSKAGELGALKTVYIGGGTPSHLGMARLSLLLYALSVSMHLTPEVECTLEANPESIDGRMVKDLWALGVNRISLGVQSFDDRELALLGRAHNADDARAAIDAIKERFDNFSIDLMAGIPGQTLESFARSVETAVALGVPHISVYPLTIEDGTPFSRAYEEGTVTFPDDDFAADAMEEAARILEGAGYRRYEVASYALAGHESRHNTAYWTGVPYLGIGRGATGMRQGRAGRIRITDGLIDERLTPDEALLEDVMLGFRMSDGPDPALIDRACKTCEGLAQRLGELADLGLIENVDGRLVPTRRGWLCGNELYGRILG